MGYRLKAHEAVSKSIRRIALEQIDKTLDHLKPSQRNQSEAIRDARVCLKKLRALLRLVRTQLTGKVFQREDDYYRKVSRRLSPLRDSTAVIDTLDKLSEHFAHQLKGNAFAELRQSLVRARAEHKEVEATVLKESVKALKAARARIKTWKLHDEGFEVLADGLRSAYRSGRIARAEAMARPKVDNFHHWRQQVKNLWYDIKLLRPVWPAMIETLANELERLGDFLSDDHDLAVLRAELVKGPNDDDNKAEEHPDLEALVALIDQRRGELELSARTLGARLYFEKPKAFATRLEACWDAWRSEVKVNPIAER